MRRGTFRCLPADGGLARQAPTLAGGNARVLSACAGLGQPILRSRQPRREGSEVIRPWLRPHAASHGRVDRQRRMDAIRSACSSGLWRRPNKVVTGFDGNRNKSFRLGRPRRIDGLRGPQSHQEGGIATNQHGSACQRDDDRRGRMCCDSAFLPPTDGIACALATGHAGCGSLSPRTAGRPRTRSRPRRAA